MKQKRKPYSKCDVCGEQHKQSAMIPTNNSSNGWICFDCYKTVNDMVQFNTSDNKCVTCFHSRVVVSENGIKHVCCLPDIIAAKCLMGIEGRYNGTDNDVYRERGRTENEGKNEIES